MLELFSLAIASGLAVGWVCGGSLSRLAAVRLRLRWLVPVALGLQMFMTRALSTDLPWWLLPLHGLSYALLFAVIVANWSLGGVRLLGAGLALNALVIFANGGLMPQAPETLHVLHPGSAIEIGQHLPRTKDVVLPREQTRLWWLSDVFASPPGFAVRAVVSAGDVVLAIGLAWVVQALIRAGAGPTMPLRVGGPSSHAASRAAELTPVGKRERSDRGDERGGGPAGGLRGCVRSSLPPAAAA